MAKYSIYSSVNYSPAGKTISVYLLTAFHGNTYVSKFDPQLCFLEHSFIIVFFILFLHQAHQGQAKQFCGLVNWM